MGLIGSGGYKVSCSLSSLTALSLFLLLSSVWSSSGFSMMLQAVYRTSWICLLLFSVGFCFPPKKGAGQQSSGSASDSGFGSGSATSSGASVPLYGVGYFPHRRGSGYRGGKGEDFVSGSSESSMDAGLSQMISDVMQMGPNRPSGPSHWNADHVPLGMNPVPPMYPSSHVVYTGSGYQRALDSRTDSKYTTDTFNNIPVSGGPQDQTGPKRHHKD